MRKKLLLAIIIVSLILAGCSGKAASNNTVQQASKPLNAAVSTSAIDYNQYIKKTWVDKSDINNWSFCISKITNGKIIGRFTSDEPAVPNHYDLGKLTGTIDNDTADCQFSDKIGNKGSIKLVFKSNDMIEATLKLTDKSQYIKQQPKEGTFQFKPYNLNDIKGGFSIIKNQSFTVDLNSWGSVKFVSGKLTAGSHIPVVFYLTNDNGDILYDFDSALPYKVDVKAISFVDVNKDNLKDIIIIVTCNDDSAQVATVYLQKDNGSFDNDPKLDQEINSSGNNKDIKTITNYLSKKF